MIKGLTESFQRLDVNRTGVVNINYEKVWYDKRTNIFNAFLYVFNFSMHSFAPLSCGIFKSVVMLKNYFFV